MLGRSLANIMNVLRTFVMLLFINVLKATGDCPRMCECKWKSGKESVLCINSNMTEIPRSLDSGTQLLDLSGNRLHVIGKDEFFNASLLNLQKIFMSRCRLRSMHRCSFRNIINLVELDLSYNELETIPSHTFEFITELRELKLNGNPIIRVLNYSFKTVPHLTKLDLSECEIIFVEVRAFQGLENSLEWLKLDKNYITNIAPLALTHLGNLHGLELSTNPWNCTCRLRPLRQWMLRHNVPYSISPICRNPSRLAGKYWDKLEIDEFACAPKIEAVHSPSHIVEGNNVTLSCFIDGVPEPSIHWMRKNQIIANLSGTTAGSKTSKLYLVRVTNQTTNLTIMGADLKDNGDYVCRAENKAGKAEASVTLAISVKSADKSWSGRMILAGAAVVMIFLIFAILLATCACSTRRQKYVYRQPIVTQSRLDSYEMNSKKPSNVGYDKIIKKENNYGASGVAGSEFSLVQGRPSKPGTGNYKAIGGDSDANEEESPSADVSSFSKRQNQPSKPLDGDDNWGGFTDRQPMPDLHIPRLNRTEEWKKARHENLKNQEFKTTPSVLLTSMPGLTSHILHKHQINDVGGTLYTTMTPDLNGIQYPDILELSLNGKNLAKHHSYCTLPRKRSLKTRRNRHFSCSSNSQSPLLPGSCGDSCDSSFSINRRLSADLCFPAANNSSFPSSPGSHTPTPLLNLPDDAAIYQDISPTNFQYKSSELEKFFNKYRNLQEQLYNMNESCENHSEESLDIVKSFRVVERNTISRLIDPSYDVGDVCNSVAVEPLYSVTQHLLNNSGNIDSVYNGNKLFLQEDNNNPQSTLNLFKHKSVLDNIDTEKDPYWFFRQKLLTALAKTKARGSYYES